MHHARNRIVFYPWLFLFKFLFTLMFGALFLKSCTSVWDVRLLWSGVFAPFIFGTLCVFAPLLEQVRRPIEFSQVPDSQICLRDQSCLHRILFDFVSGLRRPRGPVKDLTLFLGIRNMPTAIVYFYTLSLILVGKDWLIHKKIRSLSLSMMKNEPHRHPSN